MKRQLELCLLNGLLFAVLKCFYEVVPMPMPMHDLLYCTFLGITVTGAVGACWRKIPCYLIHFLIGVVWVIGYIGCESFFLCLPLNYVIAKVIAFGLVSAFIEIVNHMVFQKTALRYTALQFSVVIGVFSQRGKNMEYVLAALLAGMLTAVISKFIYEDFFRKE